MEHHGGSFIERSIPLFAFSEQILGLFLTGNVDHKAFIYGLFGMFFYHPGADPDPDGLAILSSKLGLRPFHKTMVVHFLENRRSIFRVEVQFRDIGNRPQEFFRKAVSESLGHLGVYQNKSALMRYPVYTHNGMVDDTLPASLVLPLHFFGLPVIRDDLLQIVDTLCQRIV